MDLFSKCESFFSDPSFAESLGYPTSPRVAKALGVYPWFIPLDHTEGTEVTVGDKRLIMIGSNNYLGLTADPRVRKAACDAIHEFGTSCTGSRFLNGTLAMHGELEERLAAYVGMEKALVFSTGYQTNLGTIGSVLGRDDIVICDKENHASIIDGCRLSLGRMLRYRHNDIADLERVLGRCPKESGVLVVVDGVFSMGGDLADLPKLAPLCAKYGARLMVDDAHGMGVTGHGRGTPTEFDMVDQVDLQMGTFSKSFASIGGFIAGAEPVMHWVQHTARSFIFSASLPAPNVATALAALDIMEKEPERVDRVNEIGERMRKEYRRMGLKIGDTVTPIIPIVIGEAVRTMQVWRALFEAGIYSNVAIPPAVPEGSSLLRTSYMATHTDDQMDRVLEIMEQVTRDQGII